MRRPRFRSLTPTGRAYIALAPSNLKCRTLYRRRLPSLNAVFTTEKTMSRKNSKIAAPVAAPAVDAAPVVAPPTRVGGPSALIPARVSDSPFTYRGVMLNGRPGPRPSDAPTVAPVALAASDAPALLALAASLLASCGATLDAPTMPLAATHDAVRDYLANRPTRTTPAGYFAANDISTLDEMMYLTRAAERCVYAADRLRNVTTRRAFCGGYGSSDATAARRDSIALTVSGLLNA